MECVGLLLNILPLARLCLFGDCSVEKHQEFIVAIGGGTVNNFKVWSEMNLLDILLTSEARKARGYQQNVHLL
jgi:hypothetical protein